MEIWYLADRYGKSPIEPVNVVKSTEKTVTIIEKDLRGNSYEYRKAIHSDHCHIFKTWDEAQAHMIEKSESRINALRLSLEQEKSRLGNIRGLKRPA